MLSIMDKRRFPKKKSRVYIVESTNRTHDLRIASQCGTHSDMCPTLVSYYLTFVLQHGTLLVNFGSLLVKPNFTVVMKMYYMAVLFIAL